MVHYKFKDGVYFVSGALRGAILDTNTSNVYSINEDGCQIVSGITNDNDYWEKLTELSLAEGTSDVLTLPDIAKISKISLGFVWFEIITDDCNESCIHCYADSMPPSYRKNRGESVEGVQDKHDEKLTYSEWTSLIKQSYELGCKRCQFIGGEPFLYKDGKKTVLDLAEFAIDLGYEVVEIFTNATLLNEQKVHRIQELGIRIAVSIYSNVPEVHDRITQTPGSHKKTMENVSLLKEAGVPVRVSIVVMRQNEDSIDDTIISLEKIGVGKKIDPLRPKGRGDNVVIKPSAEALIKYGYMTEPNFTAEKFKISHYSTGHSCLAGKITITDKGDVMPCIFSRNHVIGNVSNIRLEEILLMDAMQRIWHTTKDNVLVCRDCEYRYVCFDCRPLSEASSQGNGDYLSAPYPRCTYNPYTGEWAEGVWKVDENGDAYYDRSKANVIKSTESLNIEVDSH